MKPDGARPPAAFFRVSPDQQFENIDVEDGEMPTPRVPTAQLEAKGSFLKHPERKRARANEPIPTGELGEPPKSLTRAEKAAWFYIANLLPQGVAFNSDRVAMQEMACLLVLCEKGKANSSERNLLKAYLRDFGMTPADRSRVRAKAEKPKNDPWDDLDPV